MKCTELEGWGLEYLDGTMAEAERAEIESHLVSCAACAARFSEFSSGLGALHQALDGWPSMAASRSFDARVMAAISSAAQGAPGWWKRLVAPMLAPVHRPAFAGTFSAILLAAFVLVRFFPSVENSATVAPPVSPAMMALDSSEEVALVQGLTDLDDMELLRNFEVLQEMKGSTP